VGNLSSGGCYRFEVGFYEVPSLIFHPAVGQLVIDCVSKLNVPNRIWGLFHDSSNASVPPPCEADGPRNSRTKSDFAVPFFANLCQIIGPYIRRATSVGAECNDDFVIWEPGFRISPCQSRVIPFRYSTEEDPCEGLRREF
jgi:hypothetical protein